MGGSSSSLPVTVQLAGDAGGLDDAPVDVEPRTVARPTDVLAVPVRGPAGTGRGRLRRRARRRRAGRTELVAVELGAFADGFVEITGTVAEGDDVVLA